MRSALAAVALLVLGACALPQQGRSRAFQPYAPLEAYIVSPASQGPLFHVNRPAYVAMFYIVPGAGVSMLYPGFGSGSLDGRVFAGSHFANTRLNNREQYLFTAGSYGSPRFYFLIASDRPLNVNQFGSFGTSLGSRLGGSFGSFSAYSTMEDLARLSLPSLADDGSWTTDMYVEWPNVISREPGRRRVLLRCNGYEMYVPFEYVEAVQAMVCNAQDEAEERAREDPVAKPKPRQPLPADGETGGSQEEIRTMDPRTRQALVERISSSSQLMEPVTRQAFGGGRDEFGRPEGRARPGSSGATYSGSRGPVGAPASRPSSGSAEAGASSPGAPSAPSARPSGGGSVSAPSARPSSDSGGGGSSSPSAPTRNSSGGD
jgi:hypothetical protein